MSDRSAGIVTPCIVTVTPPQPSRFPVNRLQTEVRTPGSRVPLGAPNPGNKLRRCVACAGIACCAPCWRHRRSLTSRRHALASSEWRFPVQCLDEPLVPARDGVQQHAAPNSVLGAKIHLSAVHFENARDCAFNRAAEQYLGIR